jgi:hypothetical protein
MVNEPEREDPREGADAIVRPARPDVGVLTLIKTSFAGRDDVIERVFDESQAFRDLCHDYRKCVAALRRWKRLEAASTPARAQEYTELLLELDREIQTWLDSVETERPRSGGSSP